MQASLYNIIAGSVLTTFGGVILVMLGVGIGYIKNINHTLKEIYGVNIEHKTKIEAHEKQLADIYNKIYELKQVP